MKKKLKKIPFLLNSLVFTFINNVVLNHKTEISFNYLPKKNSVNKLTFFTLFEKLKPNNLNINNKLLLMICKIYKYSLFKNQNYDLKKRLIINLVFKDMIHNYKIWRQIKGYPVNGQRTWSNGKSASKTNSTLKNFRIQQIMLAYGKKRKAKAPQLVMGEYMNKLWFKTWKSEWKQAKKFNLRSSKKRGKKNTIIIDLKSLAMGITGGYKRKGQARRFNKAKKKFKNITIGLPLFFTRYIYSKVKNKKFLVDFSLMHEQRKMKSRKRVKKKTIIKKKKKK